MVSDTVQISKEDLRKLKVLCFDLVKLSENLVFLVGVLGKIVAEAPEEVEDAA